MARHSHTATEVCTEKCPRYGYDHDDQRHPPLTEEERVELDLLRRRIYSEPVYPARDPARMQHRVEALLDALTVEHRREYMDLADFNAAINLISRHLPRFIDLLAEDAHRAEAHRRTMMRFMDLRPGPGFKVMGTETGRMPRPEEDNRG